MCDIDHSTPLPGTITKTGGGKAVCFGSDCRLSVCVFVSFSFSSSFFSFECSACLSGSFIRDGGASVRRMSFVTVEGAAVSDDLGWPARKMGLLTYLIRRQNSKKKKSLGEPEPRVGWTFPLSTGFFSIPPLPPSPPLLIYYLLYESVFSLLQIWETGACVEGEQVNKEKIKSLNL
ncbi:hypothetical protein LX32DRAFT_39801 [Colletotrichum zoysiae]|uniref:Uncharacterized protein n=1 Tax=Colletotrichum zoysiae TaxID=1216348 RepID=A0AAD9HD41_9PEZI|nr:hypothetical protein LX32DRAFT_39801 [Colletotrichum zoysiae]